ncbi:multidrug resistance protein, MATE family [Geopseudomonas sagittaria]|uniref:Multidrug-efflux transporter n=1 Tax=Geopseudomonas sagittaria TaxID=1135990 RepID=A0A1I5Y190_9GAMM|nr:MATE family efflux transporter [Pseudomonas sagittaria]MCM2331067.1 MATE family efflux transporter [Pseudomonas sagittaria]SFQ37945.1 multidrug resistance protein, MATE family [Pseudomonas sagittaria]
MSPLPPSSAVSRARRSLNEVQALLALAGPIIVAQLANTAMGFVDTVMAGRVGARDLAAVALGNSIWVPLLLLMGGILLATTAKVSRKVGAGSYALIGPLVRQALWLALAIGLSAALLLFSARPLLLLMQVEAALADTAMGYLQAVALGFPALALFQVLRGFSDGLGSTRPTMVIGLLGLLLNIPLNYIFIYGKLGLPAMGGVGCGWATALVLWFMLGAMLWWVHWAPLYKSSRLFEHLEGPQWPAIRALLSLGLPIGIAIFAEASIFSVIALLIGSLGASVVAGHQVALNFSSMVFMIPYSLAMATTVRVGQALGRGAPRDARFSAGVAMATALVYACCSASLMLWLRGDIARLYTPNAEVLAVAGALLMYSALFQFSDAIQVTAAGALRGYHDTRATMLITLLAYWGIGLPIGYSLGLSELLGPPSGPAGLWQGLVIGLTCAAVLLGVRLQRIARRQIRAPA